MTVQIPTPSILDRLLRLLGKKRGVIYPTQAYKKHGPFVFARAKKESFWKALFRSGARDLPEGVIDLNAYRERLREGPEQGDAEPERDG